MASVGFLASGIAHEINNPLGYSLSNMTVLKEYADDLAVMMKALDTATDLDTVRDTIVDDNIQHILADLPDLLAESIHGLESVKQIVSDLRAFARSGEDSAATANLNEILQTTLNVLKGQIKHRYPVETHLGVLPPVTCMAGKLSQVFANIIINATQAMPDGGKVYIETRADGDHVIVEISDDGPGIPEAHLTEVFSPFFTTKPVGEGTGLGLAICYAIITEDHRGSLSVTNGAGRGVGANFKITIPLC